MAFDQITVSADTAVATNGTLTLTYPAGRSADSYVQSSGAYFAVPTLQAIFTQGSGFTLSYGATTATLTYTGATTIPQASGVALILQLPLQQDNPIFLGGAAAQANTASPVPVPVARLQPMPNPPQSDTINFGAWPGSDEATLTIIGQANIVATSEIRVWVPAIATADHSADEHAMDPPAVTAGNIVPGVGFTVYATYPNSVRDFQAYGAWTVNWQWL